MNVVFLSPHFPPNWWRFVRGLADVGRHDARHRRRQLGGASTRSCASHSHDYYRVDDLANYDQLTRALGFFIHRHGRIARLDSLNEHWLETEARLRTDFNIKGINKNTIGPIKRKSLMKYALPGERVSRRRAARCARRRRNSSASSTKSACRSWPSRTLASVPRKTYKLETEAEVERYLVEKPATDYIVEEFVRGELITYDGLTGPIRRDRVRFDLHLFDRRHGGGQPAALISTTTSVAFHP